MTTARSAVSGGHCEETVQRESESTHGGTGEPRNGKFSCSSVVQAFQPSQIVQEAWKS